MQHVEATSPMTDAAWQQRVAALRARLEIIDESVSLPGRTVRILHPRSADDLLDEEAFERDERIPYWAEIWPSAVAFAARLDAEAGRGRRLLELGSGCGLAAVAAALAGFDVLATDYYPEALECIEVNAARNGARLATQYVDWRAYPSELRDFDLVVAADVLYEKQYSERVAAAFAQSLRPGGLGLMCDPQRARAAAFPDHCRQRGLTVRRLGEVLIQIGDKRQTVDQLELRWTT